MAVLRGLVRLSTVDRMDCVFCAIAAGQIPSTRVYEDDRTVAFLDINPGSDGHMVVIPRTHSADIRDVAPEDLAALFTTAQHLTTLAHEALDCEGVNVINNCGAASGQTVFHTHVHVIPRYADKGKDRVGHPWTPHPASAESLAELRDKLVR
jgi:histidine triad (HIT) family protein